MRKIRNPWLGHPQYKCFGCCPTNPAGVKMEFYADGDEVVSYWKPEAQFQGWIDTLHGGIQAVLLDEICAWVVMHKMQTTGVTSKMETRYRKSISTNEPYLQLRAHIVEIKRNIVLIEATINNSNGELCSSAVCTYFTFSKEKAKEMCCEDFTLEDEDMDESTVLQRL